MGISPEKKTELQKQFIARPDAAKSMIIYKWPEHHIRMVSIVTVQPDEVALFVKQGQLLGYLPGGEHQLDGPAIPFLQGQVDDVTGGKAMLGELYFVSTREFANKAFAGMMGQVNDPDTDVMVGLKVFGEYAMRVVDAGKLLLRLIGTQGMLNNTEIWDVTSDHVLQTLRAVSNQNVTEHKWHVLKLTSGAYNLDIEERVLGIANERLADYGLEVTRLEDFAITVNAADALKMQDIYERRAKTRLAENPAYMTMTEAEAMLGAAEGLAKGGGGGGGGGLSSATDFAGIGIGLGIGMKVAERFMPGVASGSRPASPSVQPQVTCGSCGAAVAPGKFCGECGAALPGSEG